MQWSERFVVGRVRKRLLRAPLIDGWTAEELGDRDPARATLALAKLGGELALAVPDEHDRVKLGDEASTLIAAGDCDLMIGWPERIVIIRRGGAVLYADGDVVHFGELALDPLHRIERTGYEYLADTGTEVRVELALRVGDDERRELLEPGGQQRLGPYSITHEQSYDPSDRPAGSRRHGYSFIVRRSDKAFVPPPTDAPHPLDVKVPATLLELARQRGLLGEDEAMLGEGGPLDALLDRYEGPRQNLEDQLRQTGPAPARLRRAGESVVVEAARLGRGDHGAPTYGRGVITLDPVGRLRVARHDHGTMPGRLRKHRGQSQS